MNRHSPIMCLLPQELLCSRKIALPQHQLSVAELRCLLEKSWEFIGLEFGEGACVLFLHPAKYYNSL